MEYFIIVTFIGRGFYGFCLWIIFLIRAAFVLMLVSLLMAVVSMNLTALFEITTTKYTVSDLVPNFDN